MALRFMCRWGLHRVAFQLYVVRAIVGWVLARYRMPRLAHVDRNTGLPVRKPKPVRYEREKPGDVVRMGVKKLGRISDGGGHRTLGNRNNKKAGRGYAFLRHVVGGHSCLAYSEILADERKETVVAFWRRAKTFFTRAGVRIEGVMTDNGTAYRFGLLAAELGTITHTFTKLYRL